MNAMASNNSLSAPSSHVATVRAAAQRERAAVHGPNLAGTHRRHWGRRKPARASHTNVHRNSSYYSVDAGSTVHVPPRAVQCMRSIDVPQPAAGTYCKTRTVMVPEGHAIQEL